MACAKDLEGRRGGGGYRELALEARNSNQEQTIRELEEQRDAALAEVELLRAHLHQFDALAARHPEDMESAHAVNYSDEATHAGDASQAAAWEHAAATLLRHERREVELRARAAALGAGLSLLRAARVNLTCYHIVETDHGRAHAVKLAEKNMSDLWALYRGPDEDSELDRHVRNEAERLGSAGGEAARFHQAELDAADEAGK